MSHTHGLMVRPSEWPIRPRYGLVDLMFWVRARQRDAAECRIVRKVAQGFDIVYRESSRGVQVAWASSVVGGHG